MTEPVEGPHRRGVAPEDEAAHGNRSRSAARSAGVLGVGLLIARALGFVRDVAIASFLVAGAVAEAWLVAFRLPNLLGFQIATGAFNPAFVPVLNEEIENPRLRRREAPCGARAHVVHLFALVAVACIGVWAPSDRPSHGARARARYRSRAAGHASSSSLSILHASTAGGSAPSGFCPAVVAVTRLTLAQLFTTGHPAEVSRSLALVGLWHAASNGGRLRSRPVVAVLSAGIFHAGSKNSSSRGALTLVGNVALAVPLMRGLDVAGLALAAGLCSVHGSGDSGYTSSPASRGSADRVAANDRGSDRRLRRGGSCDHRLRECHGVDCP